MMVEKPERRVDEPPEASEVRWGEVFAEAGVADRVVVQIEIGEPMQMLALG